MKIKPICKISNPKAIHNLEEYCLELNLTIKHCYGYDKPYCPKTCSYAIERITEYNNELKKIKTNL